MKTASERDRLRNPGRGWASRLGVARWFPVLVCLPFVAVSTGAGPDLPALRVGSSQVVRGAGAVPPTPLELPPRPPKVSRPIDTLRQLLAQSPAEREKALAEKPEQQRLLLQQRLREFDLLSPAERELRLRLLALRYYLPSMMKVPAASRAEQLRLIPATDRRLIEERLEEWDKLPPETQKELLQNENVLRLFPRFDIGSSAGQQAMLQDLPPERRQKLEEELARWQRYLPDQRERMYRHFQQFFEFSESQKARALRSLTEPERRQMAQASAAFEKLPPDQRAKCIEALHEFVSMTVEERGRFLQNAARWESMTSEERRAWRELMAQLPPLPPGLAPTPPLPPMPSYPRPGLAISNAATGK